MGYTKQNFMDGHTLTAAKLNHMEAGIAAAWDMAGSGTGGGAEPEQLCGGRRKQKVQVL